MTSAQRIHLMHCLLAACMLRALSVLQLDAAANDTRNKSTHHEYLEAAKQMQNFDLHVTFSLPPSSGVDGRDSKQHAQVHFRCGSNTGVDSNMPLIGIPNFLPSAVGQVHNFYFVTLKYHGKEDGGAVAAHQRAVGSPAGTTAPAFSLVPNNDAFTDIKLGPLLGKGAFGRVYRGTALAASHCIMRQMIRL